MTELHKLVTDLIQLADGELNGRVRLQKIVYLLDHKGLESGADYIYYHYGPYSEDLWDAVSDAKFFETLKEETAFTDGKASQYSTFKTVGTRQLGEKIGGLQQSDARELLAKLKPINSTVLELAATVHWLAFIEKVPDWRSEIQRRKSGKTGNGRLDKAVKLLKELNLQPTAN